MAKNPTWDDAVDELPPSWKDTEPEVPAWEDTVDDAASATAPQFPQELGPRDLSEPRLDFEQPARTLEELGARNFYGGGGGGIPASAAETLRYGPTTVLGVAMKPLAALGEVVSAQLQDQLANVSENTVNPSAGSLLRSVLPIPGENVKALWNRKDASEKLPYREGIENYTRDNPVTGTVAKFGSSAVEMVPMAAAAMPAGIVGKLVSLGFTKDMIEGAGDASTKIGYQMGLPPEQRDVNELTDGIAELSMSAPFSVVAGKHAAPEWMKNIRLTTGDARRLAIREVATQLAQRPSGPPGSMEKAPVAQRQLGLPPVTAEPFLQPGVPALADAALKEAGQTVITPQTGQALQALRGAVEPPTIIEAGRTQKPDVQGGKISFSAEAGGIPNARQTAVKPIEAESSIPASELRNELRVQVPPERPAEGAADVPANDITKAAAETGWTAGERQIGGIKLDTLPPETLAALREKMPVQVEFTDRRAGSPTEGMTVYAPENSTAAEIRGIIEKKAADVEAAKTLNETAAKSQSAVETKTPAASRSVETLGRVSVDPKSDELLGTNNRGEPVYWSKDAKTHYSISDGRVRTGPWIEGLSESALARLDELTSKPSEPPSTPAVQPPETLPTAAEKAPSAGAGELRKVRVGKSPQLHTILRETTDPKFPTEKIFEVRNDRTGEKFEVDEASLTRVTERPQEAKTPARDLDAELRAAKLDPSSFPDNASKKAALKRQKGLIENIESLQARIRGKGGDLKMGVPAAILDTALEIARVALVAGKSVKDAVDAAIKHIRENHKGDFLEMEARRILTSKIETSPRVEGEKEKTRLSAEKAQTSPIVPEPVQERIRTAPESNYKVQPETLVEEVVSQMSDAELGSVGKSSNIYVASKLELMKRLFDEGKFDEGYGLFKEVSQTGTDFGQNINQFKKLKGATPFHVVKLVNEGLKESGRDPLTKTQAEGLAKTADEAIRKQRELDVAKERWEGAPSEEFAKAADAALAAADAAELNLQRHMNRYKIKTWPQMLKTFVQGNLLTPASHVANTTGNVFGAAMEGASRTQAAFLDGVSSLLSGRPRQITVQPIKGTGAALGGLISGIKKIPGVLAKGSGESIKGETRANLRPLMAFRNMIAKNPDIPTIKGKVPFKERARMAVEATFGIAPEIMLRMLSAADKPAYEAARARLIAEQVKLKNLKPEQARMAQKFPELVFDRKTLEVINNESADAVFQRPSKSINALQALVRQGGDWGDLAFTLAVAPYRLTPWNLVRRTLQYNPIFSLVDMAVKAAKGDQRGAMMAGGRVMTGTILYGAGLWLYENGLVGPSLDDRDDSAKERLLAGKILPPRHVNLSGMKRIIAERAAAMNDGREPDKTVATFRPGDETVDLTRIGGAGGSVIASATDIMREMEKSPDKSRAETVGALLENSTLNQASFTVNQSFLKGVTGILEAIQTKNATSYIQSLESALVSVGAPNTLSSLSRATRPYAVDVKGDEFKGVIQNRFGIFGADDYMTTKRDLWGEPMKQTPEGRNALLYHLFDISKNQQVSDDPVSNELYYLWRKTADKGIIPEPPRRAITVAKQTYPLTTPLYSRYAELVGKTRKAVLDKLISGNPKWTALTDSEKVELLKFVYESGSEFGKVQFLKEHGRELEAKPERAGFQFPE